jgi:uncharacterized protein (TIGR03067 family)
VGRRHEEEKRLTETLVTRADFSEREWLEVFIMSTLRWLRLLTVAGPVLFAGRLGADEPVKAPQKTYLGKTAKQWAARLTDKEWGERWWAAEALAEIGPPAKDAVPDLIKALKDPEHFVRGAAARALGSIGPAAADAVPALALMLDEVSLLTRPYALKALKEIGLSSKGAAEVFVKLLGDEDEKVRSIALEAFRRAGAAGKPAIPALVAVLGKKDTRAKPTALEALIAIGPADAETTKVVVNLLQDSDEAVRRKAIPTLVSIAPTRKEFLPTLTSELKSSDSEVRLQAVWALSKADLIPKDAAPALVNLLKHDDFRTMQHAVRALEKIGSAAGPPAATALADLLQDRYPMELQRGAVAALEKIRPAWKTDVPMLISALSASDPEVRQTVVTALSKVRPFPKDAMTALIRLLRSEKPFTRISAAEALGNFGPSAAAATTALADALHDKDEGQRRAAWAALEKVKPDWKVDDVPFLITTLLISDPDIRSRAIAALAKIQPFPKEALLPLVRAVEDDNLRVVLAAGQALEKIGSLNEAVPYLITSLKSSSPDTSLGAAQVLGMMRTPPKDAIPALAAALDSDDLRLILSAGKVLAKVESLPKKVRRRLTEAGKGQLAGEWQIATWEGNGEEIMQIVLGQESRIFVAKNLWQFGDGSSEAKGTYAYDATKTPNQLEIESGIPDFLGPQTLDGWLGICKLDGGTLIACFGKERPKDYTAPKGSERFCITLKRADSQ